MTKQVTARVSETGRNCTNQVVQVHEVNDLLNSICERSDVHLSFFDYMDCREEFDHVGDFVEYCGTIVREQRDTNGDVVFVNGEVVYERVQQDVCVTAMFE